MGRGGGRGGMDEDQMKLCGAVTCCILIPSVIMFACSFAILDPHQIGLHYNGPACTLDSETHDNGRYFVGLGHYFFKFPAKLEYVEFSESAEGGSRNHRINLWTKDGQEVFAEIGFYYRIRPEKLADLYYTYGFDYLEVIENIATNAFRDVSTEYNTIQFFEERDLINDRMHAELRERLLETVFVTVPRFNLLSLDMPDRFETAIVDKVIKEQEKKTLEFKKQSAVIAEEINLEIAKANKDIKILRAASTANGTLIEESARAAAFFKVQSSLGAFREELARELQLNVSSYDKLLHYMWLDIVRGQAGRGDVLFNVKKLLVNNDHN